ncbi:MAG: tonB [Rickettsiaceae bacterium]|jgi:TonB family protein|nr:tonB [Rickettsiaceae bacterium]
MIINLTRNQNLLKLSNLLSPRKYSVQQCSFAIVLLAHLALVFFVFFKKDNSVTPVLSFSVMINDLAVSPNAVSAAATATSKNQAKKVDKKIVEDDKQGEKQKPVEEQELEKLKKAKIDNAVDSRQQNAVFSKQTAAIFDAAYLKNPTPSYPPLSRKLKEQGLVLLDVYVSEAGNVKEIKIAKSSGFSRLDNAALATVKNWRFVPAKKDQQLVASWVQVPINFVLE